MSVDNVDRRVLAAIRFVDATTGVQILDRMKAEADGVVFKLARSGYLVIFEAPGLGAHTSSFSAPPSLPALGSVQVGATVTDPRGRYLARGFSVRLPRDPDPDLAGQPDSLFEPAPVRMFPSPAARMGHGWAVIRASVSTEDRPAGGSLLRATSRPGGELLASGLSDDRGEAVVAVPGIPAMSSEEEDGPVVVTEIEVDVTAYFDPENSGIPDPDRLEADHAELSSSSKVVTLASGRTVALSLSVEV